MNWLKTQVSSIHRKGKFDDVSLYFKTFSSRDDFCFFHAVTDSLERFIFGWLISSLVLLFIKVFSGDATPVRPSAKRFCLSRNKFKPPAFVSPMPSGSMFQLFSQNFFQFMLRKLKNLSSTICLLYESSSKTIWNGIFQMNHRQAAPIENYHLSQSHRWEKTLLWTHQKLQ